MCELFWVKVSCKDSVVKSEGGKKRMYTILGCFVVRLFLLGIDVTEYDFTETGECCLLDEL